MDVTENGSTPDRPTTNTRWEGYSNYQSVSYRMAKSIDEAIDAYARIYSAHAEGAQIQAAWAAEARGRIMAAALRLVPEMENDTEQVDLYEEVLDRWLEGEDQDDDEGFIQQFDEVQLRSECPGWLSTFVLDIRRVGWELGYLQAGRQAKGEPENPDEAEATAMFEE